MAEIAATIILNKLTLLLHNQEQLLTGIKDDLVYINYELERTRDFLRVADEAEDDDAELKIWVEQVRNVAYDTEDILDTYMVRFAGHDGDRLFASVHKIAFSMAILKARLRFVSAVRGIKSRVQDISEGYRRYSYIYQTKEQGSGSSRWYDRRENALLKDNSELVGIEKPRKQLNDWLISPDKGLKVYPVVGMAGLGKTTLVNEVYNYPEIKLNFTNHVWVTVSNLCIINEVLKDMIQQLFTESNQPLPLQSNKKSKAAEIRMPNQQDIENMSTHQLKEKIYQLLWQSKYVVVLDDVWNIDQWEAIKVALPNNQRGSRVMITTRNAEIASASSLEYQSQSFLLERLSYEDSWSLFSKKAFRQGCPSNLEKFSHSILRKCEGLPLAIVAISGVLATKDMSQYEWDLIDHNLSDELGDELEDTNEYRTMERILSLSYKDLPYYLKYCFLYLSIFPTNHLIESSRLIRLWVAEGFIVAKDEKTLEAVAESYLRQLIDRSLIQVAETTSEGRVKLLRIHDVLRAIFIKKSKDQNFAAVVAENMTTQWQEKVRRLSVHNTLLDVQQQNKFSKIRSLFMFGVLDHLSKSSMPILFSGGLKMLTVLDLKGAPIEIFPNAVVRLFHLRYLSLRDTKVSMIPTSIQKLQNLETLDLKRTYVARLPVEIVKLQRLRHLIVYRHEIKSYLSFGFKHGFQVPSKIGGWQSMQSLCFIEADKFDSGTMVSQLGKLNQLRRLGIVKLRRVDGKDLCSSIENMSSLCTLSLTSITEDEIIDLQHNFTPPKFLQRLYLTGRLESFPPWISSLSSLVKVFLKWSRLTNSPLQELEELPNLLHLELLQVYDGNMLCFKAQKFPSLKHLNLDQLDALESIKVEKGAMPNLEKLIIQRCRLLKKVPSGIESQSNLKTLQFFDMPAELILSISAERGGEDHWKVEHIPEVYSIYWTDDYWQTTSLQKPSIAGNLHKPSTDFRK